MLNAFFLYFLPVDFQNVVTTLPEDSAEKRCRYGSFSNLVFSHDVTAAILVSQNNETVAMLVSQTSPLGVELFSYANAFFCWNKFAYMLATWVKTL